MPGSKLLSEYAQSLGMTEADARTARNIHLSVADCKHLARVLSHIRSHNDHEEFWNTELKTYLRTAK
jgi:hypothetical protein